ncbi:uncharacterized protein LOC116200009 isoform X2 [Punica granatum]|uniref:Uncharacterized protein LOC116200009 isoform X2 n=2 Tax=Punica granatum TaxID=22663 RepID=A0A6P8CWW4_PUNGR|nr:uncharacterized protein LOC116200009 isoform X2 [Punica granatum]PKI38151.1 hypothetical protein CRG98_041404 [Punica granatum]
MDYPEKGQCRKLSFEGIGQRRMMALTGGRPLGSLLSSDRPRPSLPASPIFAPFPRQTSQQSPLLASTPAPGLKLCGCGSVPFSGGAVKAINGSGGAYVSPWDEEPYEILPSGKKAYLDEQDVVTFLDPPKELIPLDPASYNPAAYLWKKIEDIPEERRHRLLHLLNPRLIFRAWEIAGTRYEDPKLAKKSSSKLLSGETGATPLEYYYCQTSGGPFPISWINFFKMAIFCSKEGQTYGRLIGETILARLASSFHPLYFVVRPHKEVMSTEQPCDLACEFGDGLFDLQDYPEGFPKPGKHPYPFNDEVVVYIRHIGPGISVGQAWQEGKNLQQVPRKLCSEILMVKDNYGSSSDIH